MRKTLEYILWSNCTNKCKFCLQCENNNKDTLLNEEEMIKSISLAMEHIRLNLNKGDDILIVGGEILFPWYSSVNTKLEEFFTFLVSLIKEEKLRYLYVNTNLNYTDRTNLDVLLSKFTEGHIEEHLKFTTSYDVYGRFRTETEKQVIVDNLAYIRDTYPTINIVVNTIITKQLVDTYVKGIPQPVVGYFNPVEFQETYKLKYINLLPYVPSEKNREMDVSFKEIISVLAKREKEAPGTINFYIDDFDLNQNKELYEFKKPGSLVSCTAQYSECHHNSNFKRILPTHECFICKLKEIFR